MTAPVFLIGGGRDADGVAASHASFAAACDGPILSVSLDDPDRWEGGLRAAGARDVRPVTGRAPDVSDLDGIAGVYVGGGWTPGYHDLLCGDGGAFAAALRDRDLPYAGFSAGAVLAADVSIVGGWRIDGRPVCAAEAGEDLDAVEVRRGLGLVPFGVEPHATQWGTLTRLANAVASGLVSGGVAVDEHTCVEVRGTDLTVHGWGCAYRVGLGTLHVLVG
jgi:cyanophycinase